MSRPEHPAAQGQELDGLRKLYGQKFNAITYAKHVAWCKAGGREWRAA